jgi:hypothetical protein
MKTKDTVLDPKCAAIVVSPDCQTNIILPKGSMDGDADAQVPRYLIQVMYMIWCLDERRAPLFEEFMRELNEQEESPMKTEGNKS